MLMTRVVGKEFLGITHLLSVCKLLFAIVRAVDSTDLVDILLGNAHDHAQAAVDAPGHLINEIVSHQPDRGHAHELSRLCLAKLHSLKSVQFLPYPYLSLSSHVLMPSRLSSSLRRETRSWFSLSSSSLPYKCRKSKRREGDIEWDVGSRDPT